MPSVTASIRPPRDAGEAAGSKVLSAAPQYNLLCQELGLRIDSKFSR